MTLLHRPIRAGAVAVLGVAMTAAMGTFGSVAASAAPAMPAGYAALANSVPATTDPPAGQYSAPSMGIEVELQPRNAASLASSIQAIYTKGSSSYHQWLAAGQFDALYAPSTAQRDAVTKFLVKAGLTVEPSSSPFLVRATGSSAQVATALQTKFENYHSRKGLTYFQNSRPVVLPTAMASYVAGVAGLTNTIRDASQAVRPSAFHAVQKAGSSTTAPVPPACEAPYPTAAQLFSGNPFAFGYGGGPGCQGLTPAQDNAIYGAPHVGARGQGQGVTIGLFELSSYQHSDINTWAQTFFGSKFQAPLIDVNVDGGPLNPACPIGDQCPASFNEFAGDIEVDADIEMQLAIAPKVSSVVVYNAPNDETGQTTLDEWTAIANDDQVDSVSSSWAVCENDITAGFAQAENTVFEQMAMQGQSVFGAEGDTGAFSCIRSDGTTIANVLDPPSQPFVTSVGGTSLESFNPGASTHPAYPNGTETVWNVDALCSNAAPGPANNNAGGFFWCAQTGAGGGGSSQYWGRPFYQRGRGVNNAFTTRGNGTTQCSLARIGKPCREDPDVSANADEFTPYAEFCTANANTPFSACAFSANQNPAGWFGIGGTSLASPLWSAIIADRDGFLHQRTGNVNPLLYNLFNFAPNLYFHDITGRGQTVRNNGLFPVTPGYDEATGIGTPKMSALITGSFIF
ncbi:MAG: S53 family peptidase [Streptosporangiaceae bacterium]